MKQRITDIVDRLPGGMLKAAAVLAVMGAVWSSGWAVRGRLGAQVALPGEVAALELHVDRTLDSLGTRIDSLHLYVQRLARGQERVIRRVDRMICLMVAEREDRTPIGCETGGP